MSLLRDMKLVKTLGNLTETEEIMDDACRLILSDVELKLRGLISVKKPLKFQDSVKYMKHFNRSKITNKDINCALDDNNSLSIMTGLKEPYQNKYKKKSKNWKLVNKKLNIRNEIKNMELGAFKEIYPLRLEMDWMSIGGRIPNTVENSSLVNKFSIENQNSKKSFGVRLMDGEKDEKLAIKEIAPNLLSVVKKLSLILNKLKETEKFLRAFFRILKEQIQLIDKGENKLGFSKFLNGKFI